MATISNECEMSQLLNRYHDGELSSDESHRVESHLCDCATCAAELESLQKWSGFWQENELPRLDESARERLRRPAVAPSTGNLLFIRLLTAAAAVVFLIAVTKVLWQHGFRRGVPETPNIQVVHPQVVPATTNPDAGQNLPQRD